MGLVAKYDLAPDRLVSGERFSGNLVEQVGAKWEVGVHASQVRRVYGGCCVSAWVSVVPVLSRGDLAFLLLGPCLNWKLGM